MTDNTIQVPVEGQEDNQEHIDSMVKKSEAVKTLDVNTGEENVPTEKKVEETKPEGEW